MMFDESPGRVPVVRVKREGGRGWRWMNAADFDPQRHELVEDAPAQDVQTEAQDEGDAGTDADAPRRRGRKVADSTMEG